MSSEVRYSGYVHGRANVVMRNDRPLSASPVAILTKQPAGGFSWGYTGGGPMRLALALLLDASNSKDAALRHGADFMREKVAALPQAAPWQLTRADVLAWLAKRENPDQLPGDPRENVEGADLADLQHGIDQVGALLPVELPSQAQELPVAEAVEDKPRKGRDRK